MVVLRTAIFDGPRQVKARVGAVWPPALMLVLLAAFSLWTGTATAQTAPDRDVRALFEIAYSPAGEVLPEAVLAGTAGLTFSALPSSSGMLTRHRQDMWFRGTLPGAALTSGPKILEIPGHLYTRVDAWLVTPNGTHTHQQSGLAFPYDSRSVKFADVAFLLPATRGKPLKILIRMKDGVPVNFAPQLWAEDDWQWHVINKRLWLGLFLGGISLLILYNLFFGFALRDRSYFYYVGYIIALAAAVLQYTPLPAEYIHPQGTRRIFILYIASVAAFFAVIFVNNFLGIREKSRWLWRLSMATAVATLLFGMMLALRIYVIPAFWTGNVMHVLLLLSACYFLGVSFYSYLRGVKEARFLALSMLAMLSGLVIYLAYTYGWVAYHPLLLHAIEAGALAEGVLLSLALADRVNQIREQKMKAEEAAHDAQVFFTRRLLDAQEREREKIASAMHDSIGHSVLVLKHNIASLAGDMNGTSSAVVLRQQEAQLQELLHDIRGLSHDLHPHMLRRLGLATALTATVERAFRQSEIDLTLAIDDIPDSFPQEHAITLYRVSQECINNILKHATASEVIYTLQTIGQWVEVQIKDDGSGFIPGDEQGAAVGTGLGLSGMRERVELFGGEFSIETSPMEGTQIRFSLLAV